MSPVSNFQLVKPGPYCCCCCCWWWVFFFSNCSCVQVCVKTAWWGVVSLFQLRFKNGLLFVWTFCNPCGDWTMTNVLSLLFFLNILLGLQLIKPLPPWKPQPTQKCHILSTYVYQLQHNSLYKQIRYKLWKGFPDPVEVFNLFFSQECQLFHCKITRHFFDPLIRGPCISFHLK